MAIKKPKVQLQGNIEQILGTQIAKPITMRIGNPVTNEIYVNSTDKLGLIYAHPLGENPSYTATVVNDLRATQLTPDDIIKVRRESDGYYHLVAFAPESGEYMNGTNASNQVPVYRSQIIDGGLLPNDSATVLYKGTTYISDSDNSVDVTTDQDTGNLIDGSTDDTSATAIELPSTSGVSKYVLVQVDPSTNTLSYKQSDTFPSTFTYIQASQSGYLPSPDTDRKISGYVRLSKGQTAIKREHIVSLADIYRYGSSGGSVSELSDLSDVGTSTPTNRYALMGDGTDFDSRAIVEADISDFGNYLETVDLTSDVTGILPVANGGSNTAPYLLVSHSVTSDSDVTLRAIESGDTVTITASGNTTQLSSFRVGQSWEATANGTLTEFTVELSTATDTVNWEIQADDNGGDPGGTTLASGSFSSSIGTNTVNPSSPPAITDGVTYWLMLEETTNAVRWQGKSSSTYADGIGKYSNDGGSSWSNYGDYECSFTVTAPAQRDKLDQSFTVDGSQDVSSIELWLKKTGSPAGTLTLEIHPDSSGEPSGTPITNGTASTVAESSLDTDYAYVSFDFSTSPSLSDATTYWAVLSTNRTASATDYISWGADNSESYTDGKMQSESSSTWNDENKDAIFKVLGSGEQTLFQATTDTATYTTTSTSPVEVSDMSITFTSNGRPCVIELISATIGSTGASDTLHSLGVNIDSEYTQTVTARTTNVNTDNDYPANFSYTVLLPVGEHTITLAYKMVSGSNTVLSYMDTAIFSVRLT